MSRRSAARPSTPPTLADVAEEAGVSRQTVSNALNSPDLLRPDTLARVQEAIDELGYSPNRAARNLRTRSSHLVGLRVDPAVEDSANALMDRFVHSLVESTGEAGYHVLLFAPTAPRTRRPATTSCCGPRPSTRSSSPTPTAATRTPPGSSDGGRRSWRSAGRGTSRPRGTPGSTSTGPPVSLAVDHLVERGHPRIAWVGWQKGSFIGEDRRAAGRSGCTTTACPPAGWPRAARTPWSSAAGRARAARSRRSPTAFVCASDTVAMGVLRTLDELGPAGRAATWPWSASTTPGRPGGAARR